MDTPNTYLLEFSLLVLNLKKKMNLGRCNTYFQGSTSHRNVPFLLIDITYIRLTMGSQDLRFQEFINHEILNLGFPIMRWMDGLTDV